LQEFAIQIKQQANGVSNTRCLIDGDATELIKASAFARGAKADLVITSPPYPGVHVLYHRWQVDGRKETPAPYWIINGDDGSGAGHYTFGDRRQSTSEPYFHKSLATLHAIRRVVKDGGIMIQLVAFSDPSEQLPRYLANMANAGFHELFVREKGARWHRGRIWREVPNRKWHVTFRGRAHSSREVVLVHRAR